MYSVSSPSSNSSSRSNSPDSQFENHNPSGLSLLMAGSPRAAAESGISQSYNLKMTRFAAAAHSAAFGDNMGVIHTLKPRPEWIQGVAYTESQARQPIPSYFAAVYASTRLTNQALQATSHMPRRDACLVELTTTLAGESPKDANNPQVGARPLERSDSGNAMFELERIRFFG